LNEEGKVGRKRFTAEQIIGLLREADVKLSQGRNLGQICRDMGVTEQTYYRWRKEYGGMKTMQVKRLKDLEKENSRLKKAVAELTIDKLILKEALEGNY
jgi:putative transposase